MKTRSGRTISAGETPIEGRVPRKRKQTERKQPAKKSAKTKEKAEEEVPVEDKKVKTTETSTKATNHPSQDEKEPEILEKGLIYFFYRPKVEHEEVHGPDDVQKLYILLWPAAPSILQDEKEMKHTEGKTGVGEPERLIVIPKKKLPDVQHHKHEKLFGFVEKVSRRIEDIDAQLEPETYTTKTRGERHVAGARPLGEGVYAIVKHHTGDVHLVYVLELPDEPTEVQRAFNIAKEGSYVLMVKNPELPSGNGSFLKPEKKAHYPAELMKHFIGKTGIQLRFTAAVPAMLDYPGTELLFIGASDDLKTELGHAGEYVEELEHVDARKITSDKIWKELHLSKKEHPGGAVLKGKWE